MKWLDDDDPDVKAARKQYRQSQANGRTTEREALGQIKFKQGADYQMQKISWSWLGWLARGKLHVLGGQKGTGKSTIAFDLLAQITCGGKFPDGSQAPLGSILIWSGEDDIADTILPRLAVAGADTSRVYFIDGIVINDIKRAFDPGTDMDSLLMQARELPDLAAILIDPIVSAMPGDSHKNAETRRGLQPLVDLAAERNIILLGITHFTKGTQGRDPIERITGSLAFGAVPRIVLGAAKGDNEDGPRRLVRIASNIGPSGGGYEYLLQQDLLADHDFSAQRVMWGRHLEGSPLELLENSQEKSKKIQAMELLDSLLVDGPVPVTEIKGASTAHGISWPTIERAKAEAKNIVAEKTGRSWYWRKRHDGFHHA